MCLKVQQPAGILAETVRVAHAAFSKGSDLMCLPDKRGENFTAAQFADLFPAKGQPAALPAPGAGRCAARLGWVDRSAGGRCGAQPD